MKPKNSLETDYIVINYDNNKEEAKILLGELLSFFLNALDYFNSGLNEKIKINKKIEINLFDDKNSFFEYCSKTNEVAPNITCFFIGNTINALSMKYSPNAFNKIKNSFMHIFIKSFYKRINNEFPWFEYGTAQSFVYPKSEIINDVNKFKYWYTDAIVRIDKNIPDFNTLKKSGGNEINSSYSSYDVAFLVVQYLIKQNLLFKFLNNEIVLENNIIKKAIDYFNEYLNIQEIKDDFSTLDTPEELLDYMNKNIVYGWIDINNEKHYGNLKGIHELFRISSIDEIISTHLATCIEQAKLVKYFLDSKKIENKLFCKRASQEDSMGNKRVKVHAYCIYYLNNKWHLFERTSSTKRGIHSFSTYEEALASSYEQSGNSELYEIDELLDHISFLEFDEMLLSSKKVTR